MGGIRYLRCLAFTLPFTLHSFIEKENDTTREEPWNGSPGGRGQSAVMTATGYQPRDQVPPLSAVPPMIQVTKASTDAGSVKPAKK
ncbi:hypothetical protein BV898_14576 [Hypsibius exemplaris]|uniref:Uncharacterized protein n=1 Tax=Hypsibius exemplaris TaxID=2072580 RepID=A0A9X6RJP4_HYPEX|nr:hypothetical protein BV898_14576 [Hypsibius exemplaris]